MGWHGAEHGESDPEIRVPSCYEEIGTSLLLLLLLENIIIIANAAIDLFIIITILEVRKMASQNQNHHQKNPAPTEQINRYVYEVTRRLQVKQREDIEREVRSMIDDMLQDRYPGKEATLDDVNEILFELGDPAALADQYRGEKQYLIGPAYYGIYFLILKIVLAAVTFGLLVALTVQAVVTPSELSVPFISGMIATLVNGAFGAFAWVTIIFALISHYTDPASTVKFPSASSKKSAVWSPSNLPEVPSKKTQIRKSEPIVGIVFSVLLLILFNLSPEIIGIIHTRAGGTPSMISFFDMDTFHRFLPLFNIILGISLLKELMRLFEGKHTVRLSIGIFILSAASLVATILVFTNPALWNPDFISQISTSYDIVIPTDFDLVRTWNIFCRVFIGIAIFGFAVETLSNFYKAIRYGNS